MHADKLKISLSPPSGFSRACQAKLALEEDRKKDGREEIKVFNWLQDPSPTPPAPSPTIHSVTLARQPHRRHCRRCSCSTLISLNNTNQTSAGKDKAHVGCSHAAAALSIGLARANRHERGNTRARLAATKEGREKTGGKSCSFSLRLAGRQRAAHRWIECLAAAARQETVP